MQKAVSAYAWLEEGEDVVAIVAIVPNVPNVTDALKPKMC